MCVFDSFWGKVILFIKSIPATLAESFRWFLMTYLMPILQFFIIWGIKQDSFQWFSIENLKILLVANASIYAAALLVRGSKEEGKTDKVSDNKVIETLTFVAYGFTVVLFSLSMVELYRNITVLPLPIYKWGTLITLFFAILLGLITKYNEVKAKSLRIATEGKNRSSVSINNTKFDL